LLTVEAYILGLEPAGRLAMTLPCRIVIVAAASVLLTLTAPATARYRGSHPPIFVATPRMGSPITPYYYPYGSRYRYNSPGPVFYQLPDLVPHEGCRIWRYNYLYWTC
jgi:hypothetical protein